MFDKIEKITWKELTLPILPLKDALDFYQKIQRTDKIKIIEEYLRKKRRGILN